MPAAVDVPVVGIKLPDKLVFLGAGNANTEMLRHARIGKTCHHGCIIGSWGQSTSVVTIPADIRIAAIGVNRPRLVRGAAIASCLIPDLARSEVPLGW